MIVDHVVGPGHILQARIANANGKINRKHCRMVEDAWKWFCDEADISGQLHFDEIQRVDKRQDCECGEFIKVHRYVKDSSRYLPYCIQGFEADWLTSMGASPKNSNHTVDQGIEYDPDTGQAIAYHFADPDSYGKPNLRIGSKDTSQHAQGRAADVVVKGVDPLHVHAYLVERYAGKYGIGSYDSFTHIDTRSGMTRWG